MLAPIMRSYDGPTSDYKKMMTMNMPHYMFYAPYLTSTDIGNTTDVANAGPFVRQRRGHRYLEQGKALTGLLLYPLARPKKQK